MSLYDFVVKLRKIFSVLAFAEILNRTLTRVPAKYSALARVHRVECVEHLM